VKSTPIAILGMSQPTINAATASRAILIAAAS
jgi:hypothetical protein